MTNFWKKLKKPVMILAPMANVTDAAFRALIAKHGKPDVMWTEFVSADGLCSPGRDALLVDLKYSKKEKPIVAQLFGANPEKMRQTAKLCASLGFDGIDINFGCPDRTIEKQGAGAATIKNPALAREIIQAAREGARLRQGSGGQAPELPISVKTRIGYNKNEIETWLPELLKENLAALTIHLRTRKEMSDVPAHWELMKRIVEIRDEVAPDTLIIGNGDVADTDDARRKCEEFGCDGVMLGRAIFGNPFLFLNKNVPRGVEGQITIEKKLKVMLEHTKLFEKHFAGIKSFSVMKKHYKAYASGFDGAKELRITLMETTNSKQVEKIVKDFLKKKQ